MRVLHRFCPPVRHRLLEGSESLYIIDGSSYENQDNNAHKVGRPSGSLRQERHGVLSFVHLHKRFFAGFYGTNIFYRLLIFLLTTPWDSRVQVQTVSILFMLTWLRYTLFSLTNVFMSFFDQRNEFVIFWSTERVFRHLLHPPDSKILVSTSTAEFFLRLERELKTQQHHWFIIQTFGCQTWTKRFLTHAHMGLKGIVYLCWRGYCILDYSILYMTNVYMSFFDQRNK